MKRRIEPLIYGACLVALGWVGAEWWYGVHDIPFIRASAQAGWHAAQAQRAALRQQVYGDEAAIVHPPVFLRGLSDDVCTRPAPIAPTSLKPPPAKQSPDGERDITRGLNLGWTHVDNPH